MNTKPLPKIPTLKKQVMARKGHSSKRIGQIQFNIVTVERLKLAQKDPAKYGNIPVRVAGFSQMFKLIDKYLQDHIIARTKHEA